MNRRLPRKDRIRLAVGLYRSILDEPDAIARGGIDEREALRLYDSAEEIAEWGREHMPHVLRNQETGAALDFADIHRTLFAALLFHKRVLVVLPRGFGKSTICTLIYPLYLICEKRARYLMIGSYVDANAKKLVRMVREELENNAKLRAHYGDLKSLDDTWNDEIFLTADDVMVEAIYFGRAAVRGSRHGAIRPEAVILDDLETKEEGRNPERVQRLLDWIEDEIEKLYFGVQIVVVGTIVEDDCAIARLVERAKRDATDAPVEPGIAQSRFRLVMAEACDENFERLLWPEYFGAEKLRAMADGREDSFNQEMRHIPRSRKSQAFHTFHFYQPEDIAGHPLRLFMYLDFIPGETETWKRTNDTDYYSRTIVAQSMLDKKIRVMDAYHARDLTKADMVRDALTSWAHWRALDNGLKIIGEDTLFQTWVLSEIREVGREMGLYPPVEGRKPHGDKWDRIESLDHLVNTGWIQFLENDPMQKIQREELKHLRNRRWHDDMAETLEGCINQAREAPAARIEYTGLGSRLMDYFRGRPEAKAPDRPRTAADYSKANARRRAIGF